MIDKHLKLTKSRKKKSCCLCGQTIEVSEMYVFKKAVPWELTNDGFANFHMCEWCFRRDESTYEGVYPNAEFAYSLKCRFEEVLLKEFGFKIELFTNKFLAFDSSFVDQSEIYSYRFKRWESPLEEYCWLKLRDKTGVSMPEFGSPKTWQ